MMISCLRKVSIIFHNEAKKHVKRQTRCNQNFTNEAKKQKPHKLPSKSILFSQQKISRHNQHIFGFGKEKSGFLSYCALHHYKILVISTNIFPVLGKFENCIVFAHFFNLMLKMKATVRNLRHNSIISFHFKDFQDASTFFQKKKENKNTTIIIIGLWTEITRVICKLWLILFIFCLHYFMNYCSRFLFKCCLKL